MTREQRRVGFPKGIKHAGKMPVDRGQAPLLEENLSEAMGSYHVFEEVVHLLVAVDTEGAERVSILEVHPSAAACDFLLDKSDEPFVSVGMLQNSRRRVDEVIVDRQPIPGEFEERDILPHPRRLEGIDGVIGGHGLGFPFKIAVKEFVQDGHLESVVGQVHAQEVQREVLVEPAGVQVVQEAPVGHADKRAESDPGDAPQGDHAADGAVPDNPVELVLLVQGLPDFILGRHLEVPHEAEALQGDWIIEQDVTGRGQGVVVKLHDLLPGVHLREHLAPGDVERENLVKGPRIQTEHGIVALDKSTDRSRVNRALDD